MNRHNSCTNIIKTIVYQPQKASKTNVHACFSPGLVPLSISSFFDRAWHKVCELTTYILACRCLHVDTHADHARYLQVADRRAALCEQGFSCSHSNQPGQSLIKDLYRAGAERAPRENRKSTEKAPKEHRERRRERRRERHQERH